MTTDPTPFLSTIVVTSAALVAIIGGLLVARFVSLDSDQRASRKVLGDAADRLAVARDRARTARQNVLRWEAYDFFESEAVVEAVVDEGVTSAAELMRIANWPHEAAELAPFAAEVADEAKRAREALAGRVSDSDGFWGEFRRAHPDLPDDRWPQVWEHVFDGITNELAEAARRQMALAPSSPRSFASLPASLMQLPLIPPLAPTTDYSATEARRYDELVASHVRARQQVEDYEAELGRLRLDHAEIIRPDVRLWWGVGILIVFTALGVALPLWVMSQGPHDLAPVRWVFYPFALSLAALIVYIVVYLIQLTRNKPDQPTPAE